MNPLTIRTLGLLAIHVATSHHDILNNITEFEQLQLRQEDHRRVAKRKRDEYDLAVLVAAVPAFSRIDRRFWVDVRSGEWNRFLVSGIVLQDEQFEKTFRMNRNSFNVLHELLGTTTINIISDLLSDFRTLYHETRYVLLPGYTVSNLCVCILVVHYSRVYV